MGSIFSTPTALDLGRKGSPLYIVRWGCCDDNNNNDDYNRAKHEGGLFPGTLVAKPGYALIPWGGKAHKKEEFQVTLIIIHPSLYECHHCPGAGAERILAHSCLARLLRG